MNKQIHSLSFHRFRRCLLGTCLLGELTDGLAAFADDGADGLAGHEYAHGHVDGAAAVADHLVGCAVLKSLHDGVMLCVYLSYCLLLMGEK